LSVLSSIDIALSVSSSIDIVLSVLSSLDIVKMDKLKKTVIYKTLHK
jgi:hypothetical protein